MGSVSCRANLNSESHNDDMLPQGVTCSLMNSSTWLISHVSPEAVASVTLFGQSENENGFLFVTSISADTLVPGP